MSHHTDVCRSHGKYMLLSGRNGLSYTKDSPEPGENMIKFGIFYIIYIILVFKKRSFFKNSHKPD
jgi:hypothetical protein